MALEERQFKRRNQQKGILDEIDSDDMFEHKFPQRRKLKWYQHICDKSEATCLGRTSTSWCRILIFYICFLGSLAAMFAVCIQFLFLHLSLKEPTSLQKIPGISVQPALLDNEGLSIKYQRKDTRKIGVFVQQLNNMLETFEKYSDLSYKKLKILNITTNNIMTMKNLTSSLGNCTKTYHYGYTNGQPCVFIKLNKILGFSLEPYRIEGLPNDMPQNLIDHIRTIKEENRNHVWVSCDGLQSVDKENLGEVLYYPSSRGILVELFPINSHPIAVQFPSIALNQKLTVECRLWAKNIPFEKINPRRDLHGSVTFDINIS